MSHEIGEAFEAESGPAGFIGHGYTYSGHPVGAAAGIACLAETRRLNVVENAGRRGDQLYQGLLELQQRHEIIGDVRGGRGLMLAMELTSDRSTKAALPQGKVDAIHRSIYEAGVMVRVSGPNILMSPPLVLSEDEVGRIIAAVDAGLSANRRTG